MSQSDSKSNQNSNESINDLEKNDTIKKQRRRVTISDLDVTDSTISNKRLKRVDFDLDENLKVNESEQEIRRRDVVL